MDKKAIAILISGLFVTSQALAQADDWRAQGSIGVGGIGTSTSNAKDKSTLDEYRDLSDGVLSIFGVRARGGPGGWLDAYGENIGRDDMYLAARGGIYDVFKARVYTDRLRHNFVFDALSPFAGVGTNTLTATFPRRDPATWNVFDIGYKRRDTGGYLEWQSFSPWYFRVDGNEVKSSGTKLGAGPNGTSPGNGFVDLAFPVEYKTSNVSVEGGYSTPTVHFAVNYLYSRFNNDNETLHWNNPFFGNGVDTTFLPPDNHYQRISANATFRQLPLNSTLAARYTWSRLESSADLLTQVLNGTGASTFAPTNPDVGTFNGKVDYQTLTLALASTPLPMVDTRLYYNYYKRKNDSTEVTFTGPAVLCGGLACENPLYAYTKNNVGFDVYWRFLPGQRLGGGYEYWNIDRNREDYDHNTDNKFFVEYKNTMLANLAARLKYQYLQRRSHFLRSDEGVNANDAAFLERFVGRFDLADLNQNYVKLTVDWSPAPMFDFSFEGIWKDNDYRDSTLGRTKDRRDEIYASASYGDPSKWRFTLFGDIENIKYDSSHRSIGAGSCPTTSGGVTANNCFDPNTPPNSIAYNWSATNKDRNWTAGVGLDWPAMDRLMVKASFLYYKTHGTADMAAQNNFGNPLPINDFDTSAKTSFNLKGVYDFGKNWAVTLGYAYEKYEYSDDRFNGYQYTIPFPGVVNNTSQSYLNGYNAFTPYTANIFYGLVTYRF